MLQIENSNSQNLMRQGWEVNRMAGSKKINTRDWEIIPICKNAVHDILSYVASIGHNCAIFYGSSMQQHDFMFLPFFVFFFYFG